MTLRAATALALVCALAALFAPRLEAANGASPLSGTLVVVGDSDCAPYVFAGPKGEPSGFEVELLKAIAAKRGVALEFRLKPWNMALRELCFKKADILIGAVYANSFAGLLDYTIPDAYDQYAIFAKRGFKFKNIGELAMYDTAIPRMDPVYEVFLAPSGVVRNRLWTETLSDAFKELGEGRCGYVAAPYEAGMEAIGRLGYSKLGVAGEPAAPCVRRFAVRKGSAELLAFLNEGIDQFKADPACEKLREKWLKNERKTMDRTTAIKYGLYVVIPLILLLDGLLAWSLILKRQVKRKSKDLQESESNYRALFEGVGDAIVLSGPDGRIAEANAGAERLFGMDREEMAGRKLSELLGEAAAKLSADGQQGKAVELQFKRKDGQEMQVEASSGQASVGLRKLTLSILRDIGERKLAERLRADVDRMTRHDLKGPLNGILSVPDLIRERGNLTEQQLELLKIIEDAGWQMLNMINLSGDMFKLEKGVYELRPTSVNLSPLVKRLLVEARSLASIKKITVETTLDGKPFQEISPFRIWGEELLCHAMLSNLLKNAIEASPEGASVQLNLKKGPELQTIEIKNRGAVPREIRERFFDKYSSSGKKGGTGLGTYNAMLIAKVHGGGIKMDTSEQDGTTISVTIPIAKEL